MKLATLFWKKDEISETNVWERKTNGNNTAVCLNSIVQWIWEADVALQLQGHAV